MIRIGLAVESVSRLDTMIISGLIDINMIRSGLVGISLKTGYYDQFRINSCINILFQMTIK